MKIYKEGEKSKLPCLSCKDIKVSTYKTVDSYKFKTDKGEAIARKILLGVCDSCSTINSIPHQSVDKMIKAINTNCKE